MNFETESEQAHFMTKSERDTLKAFARRTENLENALIMIAHWMSCQMDISFSAYAANWAAAQTNIDVEAIRRQWPLKEARMIADNETGWGSYLRK